MGDGGAREGPRPAQQTDGVMAGALPTYHFHVSRSARERYSFGTDLFSTTGNVVSLDLHAARTLVARMNASTVPLPRYAVEGGVQRAGAGAAAGPAAAPPAVRALRAGDLNALGLVDEVLHVVVGLYRRRVDPAVFARGLGFARARHGETAVDQALLQFVTAFPPPLVAAGVMDGPAYLESSMAGATGRQVVLEEMLLLSLANANPAFAPFKELFDDQELSRTPYPAVVETVDEFFRREPFFGPDNQDLVAMLRSPALAAPDSLAGQLEFIRKRWGHLIEDLLLRLLTGTDLLREEERLRFGAFTPGPPEVYQYVSQAEEREAFSADTEWMPRTVMIARNALVWLDQLSRRYRRDIRRLDAVPDEELDRLAAWGFTALWLIGVWERSGASREIKRRMGNPEAEASAYSLHDYTAAPELGGQEALDSLRERAWRRGIRLASDMVPNHTGVDSAWMRDHPERFLSWPHPWPPFPAYTFNGPDISQTPGVGVYLEDHYWDRTDAAVVFKRVDRASGQARLIYHGNDGTHMPWNDTAQLDFLNPATREAVIQAILHVARMFPIIRFDAAMTLARKHFQRLWYPEPGSGGDIPSRAGNGLSRSDFERAMPVEFWREVVDRVAKEAPGTLLLAEAFWMLEGFFVRTLGMHRVYNSAFMHMLMKEDNAGYRQTIRNTLEFDPEVLKRFVNFMSNPDEETTIAQFGDGDKYLGVCTVMVTLPGLPMFAHGQVEGLREKYGMEYRRSYRDEQPSQELTARHEQAIFPLLRRRSLFSGVRDFLLYDFSGPDGGVNEHVFAYSNREGDARSLVLYNNRFADARGWVKMSAAYAVKSGSGSSLARRSLAEGLALPNDQGSFTVFRDHASGLQHLRSCRDLHEKGLYAELGAYQRQVFLDFSVVADDGQDRWTRLAARLGGRGVPSMDDAMLDMLLQPLRDAFAALLASREEDAAARRADFLLEAAALGAADVTPREPGGPAAAVLVTSPGTREERAGAGPRAGAFVRMLSFLDPLRGVGAEPPILSWIDQWRLGPILAAALQRDGWDRQAAEYAASLLSLAWHHESPGKEGWFGLITDPAAERFLGVNTFEGVRWFRKEALELLVECMQAMWSGRRHEVPDAQAMVSAAEKTGYRWDVFVNLAALKSVSAAEAARAHSAGRAAGTTPRAPRAENPSPRKPRRR